MAGKSLPDLLAALTLDEKAALTAGRGIWHMNGVARLGIPDIKVTDGPNGARGEGVFGLLNSAACFPCGTALGATWNPALVERIGVALGEEAKTKACAVLLAPTVNLHRSPLFGRNFECFSEDPLLSARLAVPYVKGVQSQQVACVIKHFVANDSEFERMTINSVVDERTLRELYLVPFEAAVTEGNIWGVMTAYNRLNGTFCTENDWLLRDILKSEWEFDGIVMTDWFSHVDTINSPRAGLDIEMPGPARMFGPALAAAAADGQVDPAWVNEQAQRLLRFVDRVQGFDSPMADVESVVDLPEHRAVMREAAGQSIVLLKNDDQALPIDTSAIVALIGHQAGRLQLYGGGSAQLQPHYRDCLIQCLQERLDSDGRVDYSRGAWVGKIHPTIEPPNLRTPDGRDGMLVEYLAADGSVSNSAVLSRSEFVDLQGGMDVSSLKVRATARFRVADAGRHELSLIQAGGARVSVNGAVIIDGIENPIGPGEHFFGFASDEVRVGLTLESGWHDLHIEFSGEGAMMLGLARVGLLPPLPDDLVGPAVSLARRADVAIVVVGTNDDFESEGSDRPDMDLPCEQAALIRAVAKANPNTVVVINAASPVSMDWEDEVAAVLQCWFGGQELANALCDVLTGSVNPSGHLPTTIPLRLEHSPSYGNFPGEAGEIRYGEGLLMGYRHFDTRNLPVRYAFGHGLSYTSFVIGPSEISESTDDGELTVTVTVKNSGGHAGAQVVQAYVEPPAGGVFRPRRELKAFERVELAPGQSANARLSFDKRSFSHWDQASGSWKVHGGDYVIHIGSAIDSIDSSLTVSVDP